MKIGRNEFFQKVTLGMALDPNTEIKLEEGTDSTSKNTVDQDPHQSSHPLPDELLPLYSDTTVYPEIDSAKSGNSTKTIHDFPIDGQEQRVMTKPYFATPQNKSWIDHSTQGWSTLASRSIYDAAGVGDISEKVFAHAHKDTPVVVHQFGKNYNSVYDLVDQKNKSPNLVNSPIQKSIDPLQVKQIATMDFLMGNNDRHSNNLMISDSKNKSGYNSLLAIDHDNNFQYIKPLNSLKMDDESLNLEDSPRTYLERSALNTALEASPTQNKTREDLYEWWVSNADAIKNSFDEQLSHIKDEDVKDHVQKNFERRFQMIQKWADPDQKHSFKTTGLFENTYPNVARIIPKPKTPAEVLKQIKGRMPTNDPITAIKIIGEAFKKQRPKDVQKKLIDLFNSLFDELYAPDVVELYDSVRGKGLMIGDKDLEYSILHGVVMNYDTRAKKELVKYDGGTGKISPFWIAQLK